MKARVGNGLRRAKKWEIWENRGRVVGANVGRKWVKRQKIGFEFGDF